MKNLRHNKINEIIEEIRIEKRRSREIESAFNNSNALLIEGMHVRGWNDCVDELNKKLEQLKLMK